MKCSVLLLPGSVAKKPKLRSLVPHNVELRYIAGRRYEQRQRQHWGAPHCLPLPPSPFPATSSLSCCLWPGVALINADAVAGAVAIAFAVVSESAAASEKVFRFVFLLFCLLRHS